MLHVFVTGALVVLSAAGAYAQATPRKAEKAVFAGGCFWFLQGPFEKINGVTRVVAGYVNGTEENPTYENYVKKGYIEAVEVTYDPAIASYTSLLETLWRRMDPTDPDGQFNDRGPEFRTGIYYYNQAQRVAAEKSKKELAASGRYNKPLLTPIIKFSSFYAAEDYHQDFYKKHPFKFMYYGYRSGRNKYLKTI
jgi:peptide methionine sulfoxide reductase msrA/msrB